MAKKVTKKKRTPRPKVQREETISPAQVLTKPQQYYIRGNMEVLSRPQIADELGLPLDLVESFIDSIPENPGQSRTSRLFKRPARGVLTMTAAASMCGDDMRNRSGVTRAEINRAAAAGDYKLAAELTEKAAGQKTDANAQLQARNGHFVHYIRGPGHEPEIDKD